MSKSTVQVILGICAIIAGGFVIADPISASLSIELFVGSIFTIVGVASLISAFRMEGSRFWAVAGALMMLVLGIVMLANPLEGLIALTVLVAAALVLGGIFRIALALTLEQVRYGWPIVVSGLLSIILGVMIFADFPRAAVSVLGLFLGIELILVGLSMLVINMGRSAESAALSDY